MYGAFSVFAGKDMVVKVTDSETQRPVEFSSVCLASIDSVLYKTTTDM